MDWRNQFDVTAGVLIYDIGEGHAGKNAYPNSERGPKYLDEILPPDLVKSTFRI